MTRSKPLLLAITGLSVISFLCLICSEASAQNLGKRSREGNAPAAEATPLSTKQEKTFPTGASWVLTSLNGKTMSGERPTMSLDGQYRMRGFSGCNTYSSTSYPLRQQHLAVGPFALTKKSCSPAIMAQEQAFLVALRTSQIWDLEGPTLVIKGGNGTLRFERGF